MKKDKKVLVIQKYENSKKVTILLKAGFIILIIIYGVISEIVKLDNNFINSTLSVILNIAKEVILIIVSIIGTTLLTSLLIEINQKNTTYTEMLANDIFADPKFYSNLTEENKKKMLLSLETNFYNMNAIQKNICDLFRQKLNSISHNYYYEECNCNVSYFPNKNYDEKNTVRTMKVRSYDNEYNEKNFYFFSYSLNPENVDTKKNTPLEIVSLSINGREIYLKNIEIKQKDTVNQLSKKNGYKLKFVVSYKDNITLSSDHDTIIRIEYKTRSTITDNSFVFRVPVPCKKYILNFTAPNNYKVVAHMFGLLDNAPNSSNNNFDNSISVIFDNWIVPGSGVTICCTNKDAYILNDAADKEI